MSEDGRADAEMRVWAVGRLFDGPAARVEGAELDAGEGGPLAGLRDVRGFVGGEEHNGYG